MILLLIPLIVLGVLSSLVYKWNRQSPIVSIFSSTFFGTIICGVMFAVSFAWTRTQFHNISWLVMLIMFVKGIFWIAQVFVWVRGIKYVPVSIADPFTMVNMLVLLGLSWLIFSDAVSYLEIVLVIIVFGACLTMGMLQHKQEKTTSNHKRYIIGMLWISLWVLLSTINTCATRFVAEEGLNIFTFCFLECVFAFPLTLLVIWFCGVSLKETFKKSIGDEIQYGIGVVDNVPTYLWIPLALTMNLGILEAITVLSTVITIIIGVIFMREKLRWYIYPFIIAVITSSVILAVLSG